MKARLEKKLSKRLVEIAPTLFRSAWICSEPSELAEEQATRVSHVYHVGGGVDYWGEGEDAYTAWERWLSMWPWYGDFDPFPPGHEFEHFPNTDGFKATTRNLLRLAAEAEAAEVKARLGRTQRWQQPQGAIHESA